MLMAVQHQVGVNLIGEDFHTVADADTAHGFQLLLRPGPAHGVVGVAEDEQFHAVDLGLEVLQVHGVVPGLVPLQGADHHGPSRVLNDVGKGVVHWLLDDNLVPGLGEHGQDHPHAGHHAGGEGHLLQVWLPAVARLLPPGHGLKILGGPPGIAEDALIGPGLDGLHDAGGGAEIHVGDPKGDDVVGAVVELSLFEFGRIVL